MPEIRLDRTCVVARIRQSKAAGMAEHVGMRLDAENPMAFRRRLPLLRARVRSRISNSAMAASMVTSKRPCEVEVSEIADRRGMQPIARARAGDDNPLGVPRYVHDDAG